MKHTIHKTWWHIAVMYSLAMVLLWGVAAVQAGIPRTQALRSQQLGKVVDDLKKTGRRAGTLTQAEIEKLYDAFQVAYTQGKGTAKQRAEDRIKELGYTRAQLEEAGRRAIIALRKAGKVDKELEEIMAETVRRERVPEFEWDRLEQISPEGISYDEEDIKGALDRFKVMGEAAYKEIINAEPGSNGISAKLNKLIGEMKHFLEGYNKLPLPARTPAKESLIKEIKYWANGVNPAISGIPGALARLLVARQNLRDGETIGLLGTAEDGDKRVQELYNKIRDYVTTLHYASDPKRLEDLSKNAARMSILSDADKRWVQSEVIKLSEAMKKAWDAIDRHIGKLDDASKAHASLSAWIAEAGPLADAYEVFKGQSGYLTGQVDRLRSKIKPAEATLKTLSKESGDKPGGGPDLSEGDPFFGSGGGMPDKPGGGTETEQKGKYAKEVEAAVAKFNATKNDVEAAKQITDLTSLVIKSEDDAELEKLAEIGAGLRIAAGKREPSSVAIAAALKTLNDTLN